METLLTVFTPTYNRIKTMKRLYESLISQTDKRFVWLIIDDGSVDGTEGEVQKWLQESSFPIEYVYQRNQGKSAAFNKALDMVSTELFTCVDSDDYLANNAVERILECWDHAKANDIGILTKRTVTRVPESMKSGLRTTLVSAYRKHHLRGDTMLIYKSGIIKKYRFPQFEKEKHVPPDYLHDLLDKEGEMIFLNEVLYLGEYLNDGISRNIAHVIQKNPLGFEVYILQRLANDSTVKYKFLDSIRYVAIEKVKKENILTMLKKSSKPIYTFFAYPFGLLLYATRYK